MARLHQNEHDYFRNVHKLQTVSSLSIQAWFKEDPVPEGIDSMVTGMPEPFGILCPITRVRATQPPEELPLRHEIIATGPEQGYEDIPDEGIKAGFIKGLREVGFRVPDDPAHMHVVLRRNREPFHRYLLTRPGELHWRPPHQSPLENLCLSGAWVRNEFALPCVDAAAQGAIKVAGLIAARALAPRKIQQVRRFAGMPRSASLVLPPPYRFPRSTASIFLLNANRERLIEAIPPDLKLIPGFGGRILFAVLRHEDRARAQCGDPSGARYGYNEVLLAAFVREKGLESDRQEWGSTPSVFMSMTTRRWQPGAKCMAFRRRWLASRPGAREISLVRRGLCAGRGPQVPCNRSR